MSPEVQTTTEKPTDAEIADAANTLFQMSRGYLQKDDRSFLNSITLLERAGKEAVRKVIVGDEELLPSRLWATEEEETTARISISQQLRKNLGLLPFKISLGGPVESDIRDVAMLNLDKFPDLKVEGVLRLTRDLFLKVMAEFRAEVGLAPATE
jgi:hypothetical protein